ncbi:uncharacterized protein HMPREF1541_09717 [Cyphellophora europaea CBS 101466]|uniref:Serine aminopeptidase S33 domain-containing protein n=1 Tax=Cyphellophora europaea (strain CBS 101466) TaxID=1220924 RepID=W2S838_CYPE1|nr:uncharacterized protein HMPREF1541_09717 [Cyphellophora europaea CBS 101466]ETN44842.1 hypothetical protein HMPREF1541_09717 [Cyphellophora europaea CBS 101466]
MCKEYSITVNATSENYKWALDPIMGNDDRTAISAQIGRRDVADVFRPLSPPTEAETAVYTIAGTFCEPSNEGSNTLLVATHGGGYDRAYWHPGVQHEKYSFVDFAIAKGFSIFYYDRVSTGKSQIISGYVAQISNQGAILKGIVEHARAGQFPSPASNKVVLVGHSIGSIVSNSVLRSDPALIDAAILTGVAYYGVDSSRSLQSRQSRVANAVDPIKYDKLDGAYNFAVDKYANAENFFKYPYYDQEVLQWAEEYKVPSSIVEDLTVRATNTTSPEFEGPVLIMSGEYDFVACEGYCPGVIEKGASEMFPVSKNLVTYSHPNSGHSINLGLNATGSFEVITEFLKGNGF